MIYRFALSQVVFYLTIVNKTRHHCHSWLAGQYIQSNRLTSHIKRVIQVAVKSNFLWKLSKNHKTCHQLISRQLICQISNKVTIQQFIKIANNYMYEGQSQTLYYYWSKFSDNKGVCKQCKPGSDSSSIPGAICPGFILLFVYR